MTELCLSLISPELASQVFRTCPRVSGFLLHFGQVVTIQGLAALFATDLVGKR